MSPLDLVVARARSVRRHVGSVRLARREKYFFGQTRFSIFSPGSRSWQLTRGLDDPDEYARTLYSEERMGPRCEIFCNLAAPTYQRMADRYQYHHFVMYSPTMPARWRARLEEAAQRYPVLQLMPTDTGQVQLADLAAPVLGRLTPSRDALVFGFRIDDDDLLSEDYLDQIAPLVTERHHGYAISLAKGYAGIFEHGAYTEVREFDQPLIAIGLGTVGRWRARSSQLDLPKVVDHRRTHHRRPVVLDARRATVLWTRHVAQDSAPARVKNAPDAESARASLRRELRGFPRVDNAGAVLERFPALRDHITLG